MIDDYYSDPCSLGPLNCNVDCHPEDDSDVESVSIFSTISRKSRKSLESLYGNSPIIAIEALKQRIAEFESKGWLSQQEHRHYMTLLLTAPKHNKSNLNDQVMQELEKELDVLEEKMNGGTMMLKKQTRIITAPTPKSEIPTPAAAAAQHHHYEKPKSSFGLFSGLVTGEPDGLVQVKPFFTNITNTNGSSIAAPKELSRDLTEEQISELFVETCFFARLGFVQPPCCLQCTYRESMKEEVPNKHCGRWVIWRRDANVVLHPSELDNNAIAVRCHASRELLANKTVDNLKWDTTNRVLTDTRSAKTFIPGVRCI